MTSQDFFWVATGKLASEMSREELMEVIDALLHVIDRLQGTEDRLH